MLCSATQHSSRERVYCMGALVLSLRGPVCIQWFGFAGGEQAAWWLQVHAIFELMDTDKDGNIDAKELRKALKAFGYSLSDAEVDQLMSRIDLNMDGARPQPHQMPESVPCFTSKKVK